AFPRTARDRSAPDVFRPDPWCDFLNETNQMIRGRDHTGLVLDVARLRNRVRKNRSPWIHAATPGPATPGNGRGASRLVGSYGSCHVDCILRPSPLSGRGTADRCGTDR